MDISIEFDDLYSFDGILRIFKYEDNEMTVHYDHNSDVIVLTSYSSSTATTLSTKMRHLQYHDDDEWESWAFQENTIYDVDFDKFKEILLRLRDLIDYVELYIFTLPII